LFESVPSIEALFSASSISIHQLFAPLLNMLADISTQYRDQHESKVTIDEEASDDCKAGAASGFQADALKDQEVQEKVCFSILP
jgi:cell division protein FtsX